MNHLYRVIVEETDNPIIVCDRNRNIIFANNAFISLLNLNNFSYKGIHINELIDHGALNKFKKMFDEVFSCDQTDYFEINFVHNKTIVPINVKVVSDNGYFLIIGIPYDEIREKIQTELFLLNNEVSKLNRELNKKVSQLAEMNNEINVLYSQLEEEVNKATEIHKAVLPDKISQTETISIVAHYQPATFIGGDSYNVIKYDNKLIIYLADVMGHGLDGAMISVFIKEAIGSFIQLKPDKITPGQIIEHLSERYYRENYPDDQLICIFIVVIDLESMELRYSSAGFHNYPFVHWGTGEREELKTSGLFISNMVPYELLNFEESSVYLDKSTTIMFSTDGLVEQRTTGELFKKHAEEVFYRYSHFPPEIIAQAVIKEFCFFNNHSLVGDDDITFLVLQVGNQSHQHKNYCFEIPSDLSELDPLYENISGILSGHEEQENFLTCLHELIANAIEHGNQFNFDKKVAINLTLTQQYIAAEVEDEGEGFNWCEKLNKPLNIENFSERGRGIPLSNLLSRNLFYNPKGNRAILVIEK